MVVCCVEESLGQAMANQTVFRRPTRGTSKASGMVFELADDGLGGGQFGYRRLIGTLQTSKPAASDIEFKVVARVSDYDYRRQSMTVIDQGVLPAGAMSATLDLRVPQMEEWTVYWWDVFIDGQLDRELSCPIDRPEYNNNQMHSRWEDMAILQLHAISNSSGFRLGTINQIKNEGIDYTRVSRELPEHWLDFTPYDQVVLSLSELSDLKENSTEQYQALLTWIHAGGELWLKQTGETSQLASEVNPLFGWPADESTDVFEPDRRLPASERYWSYAFLPQNLQNAGGQALMQDYGAEQQARLTPSDPSAKPFGKLSKDWFVQRRYGWGKVVAFDTNYYDQSSIEQGFRESGSNELTSNIWSRRHGLVPGYANYDFNNWLIPGVGLAPVISFQVLITLFVIAIGPLNYWLLRRAGRLHLMVVTVPAAAFLVTACLLAYGFLADGFSTRMRAQSITLIDQQQDQATTWNRLSYYAAFAPSNGLAFSDQAAVYVIEPDNGAGYSSGYNYKNSAIEWALLTNSTRTVEARVG
ncbi:hypothetical protein [Aeoliella mucimassa]|uniref:hypothetical protein n=1 Tax=Aeoliella mucimassa TaxID=2527972 RepID=UPI001E44D99D|nr:hypothetical protein [Aeoliella mucimassa]